MGANPEFIKRGEEILDFIDAYGALRTQRIEKFFPNSRKIVDYLIKNKRLYQSPDGIYIGTDQTIHPDKRIIAALGVLADIFHNVKNHAKVTSPAQISFITHAGDYYEIIYVGYGMEALVTATIEPGLVTKNQGEINIEGVKRIIIIEDKNQMDRLLIPQTTRYALVLPDGSLTYFRGS